MTWHSLEFRGGGAGSYSLSATVPIPSVRMITKAGDILIANWTCENLQYQPDSYVADYLNVTYASSATALAQLKVDFMYTRNALNVREK